MTSEGAIFDLDYRRYEGERTGRAAIRWSMVRDGVRKVLGLRRKARRKVLPWGLILLAVLPAIAIVGFQVLTQGFGADEVLEDLVPGPSDYFGLTFQLTFLFVALSAPELLIPDRVNNVLTVYASRPLTLSDYLIARVAALLIVIATFTLIPQIVLYFGSAILSGDIIDHITNNLDLLWQIPAGALAVFASQAGIAFIISAYARRRGVAAGVYIAFTIISGGVAFGMAEAVNRWFALLDLQGSAILLVSRIFDDPALVEDTALAENDITAWASLAVVVGIAVVAGVLLYRRYRRLM